MSESAKRDRLYDGDTFEYRGATFRVRYEVDDNMGPPWSEHDGHGDVREATVRSSDRHVLKAPGERVIYQDGRLAYVYDVQGAIRKALAEGWDTQPFGQGTKRQQAARAVEADIRYCAGWLRGDWSWIGVIVRRIDKPEGPESLWGIDGEGEYLTEVAYELADQILGSEAPDVIRTVREAGAGL